MSCQSLNSLHIKKKPKKPGIFKWRTASSSLQLGFSDAEIHSLLAHFSYTTGISQLLGNHMAGVDLKSDLTVQMDLPCHPSAGPHSQQEIQS